MRARGKNQRGSLSGIDHFLRTRSFVFSHLIDDEMDVRAKHKVKSKAEKKAFKHPCILVDVLFFT